jgi:hypothetical protein
MTRWGKFGLVLCALALFGFVNTSNADITIEVFPAYAPNGPASPNWLAYTGNAITGITAGGANTGTGPDRDSDPAYYELVTGVISPSEIIYTEFNSWRGTAANNPAFTGNPAVTGEFGNRVHFGTRITATSGMEFALNDVSWTLDSDDDTDFFDQNGTLTGNYSATRVGLNYGTDGVKGTADDMSISSGAGTQLVNELVYVGVGDGFESENSAAPTDQDDINATLAVILSGCEACEVMLTGTYMVGDASGSGKITLAIPEPSTIVLASFGVLALGLIRKRR